MTKAVEIIEERGKLQSDINDRSIKLNMSLPSLKEKIFLSVIEGNLSKEIYESYIEIGFDDDRKTSTAAAVNLSRIEAQSNILVTLGLRKLGLCYTFILTISKMASMSGLSLISG